MEEIRTSPFFPLTTTSIRFDIDILPNGMSLTPGSISYLPCVLVPSRPFLGYLITRTMGTTEEIDLVVHQFFVPSGESRFSNHFSCRSIRFPTVSDTSCVDQVVSQRSFEKTCCCPSRKTNEPGT